MGNPDETGKMSKSWEALKRLAYLAVLIGLGRLVMDSERFWLAWYQMLLLIAAGISLTTLLAIALVAVFYPTGRKIYNEGLLGVAYWVHQRVIRPILYGRRNRYGGN